MASNSSGFFPFGMFFYVGVGSADHAIGVPVNCWALCLIVSRSLIQSEILTLNLVIMELVSSLGFFMSLVFLCLNILPLLPLVYFYNAAAVLGRTLFQLHICVDRYLAVVHPATFIRYKQMRYRGACLAALWLFVICSGVTNAFVPYHRTSLFVCSFTILLPALSTELYCSLSILWILTRPGPGDNKEAKEKREGNQQKMRAAQIIWIVLVTLVFNMVPFILVPWLVSAVPLLDLISAAFILATVGNSVQSFLFLSRSGKLPCKSKG